MSDQAKLDAQAQALRAQGLKYREIGARMGETKDQAWKRCNRESANAHTRAYKERTRGERRAYDRRYGDEHRAECPHCGHVYGSGSGTKGGAAKRIDFTRCPGCRNERRDWIVCMWDGGAAAAEMAEALGWSKGHLTVEMVAMRADGYDLPYRRAPRSPVFPEQVAA